MITASAKREPAREPAPVGAWKGSILHLTKAVQLIKQLNDLKKK